MGIPPTKQSSLRMVVGRLHVSRISRMGNMPWEDMTTLVHNILQIIFGLRDFDNIGLQVHLVKAFFKFFELSMSVPISDPLSLSGCGDGRRMLPMRELGRGKLFSECCKLLTEDRVIVRSKQSLLCARYASYRRYWLSISFKVVVPVIPLFLLGVDIEIVVRFQMRQLQSCVADGSRKVIVPIVFGIIFSQAAFVDAGCPQMYDERLEDVFCGDLSASLIGTSATEDPGVFQQFLGCDSEVRIFLETLHEEVANGLHDVSNSSGGWSSLTMRNKAGIGCNLCILPRRNTEISQLDQTFLGSLSQHLWLKICQFDLLDSNSFACAPVQGAIHTAKGALAETVTQLLRASVSSTAKHYVSSVADFVLRSL
ncbi:hypothetical protein KCU93_g272, partial [Aureobasidium melanogenum]